MKFNSLVKQYALIYETENFGGYGSGNPTAKPFILFKQYDLLISAKNGGEMSHMDIIRILTKELRYIYKLKTNKKIPSNFKISSNDLDNSDRVLLGRIWDGEAIENRTPIGFWVDHIELIRDQISLDEIYKVLKFFNDKPPAGCIYKFTSFFSGEYKIFKYEELLEFYK